MTAPRYYYLNGSGETIGPFTASALMALGKSGAIAPTTPVIAEESDAWSTAAAFGFIVEKKKRSIGRILFTSCAVVLFGYVLLMILAIVTLHSLGPKAIQAQQDLARPKVSPQYHPMPFDGSYQSETMDAPQSMHLLMRPEADGFVGELTLAGDPQTTVPATGYVEGKRIVFVSRASDGVETAWRGDIRDGKIVGRFESCIAKGQWELSIK